MKNICLIIISGIVFTGCSTTKLPVTAGMTPKEVRLTWDEPQKILNNKNSCCKLPGEEVWYYFSTPYQKTKQPKYVFFKDQVVQDVFVW